SASDSTTRKLIRGPQPELVRDYELLLDGRVLLDVQDNLVRKRVHRLTEAVTASRLQLRVNRTHGVSHARVFEIRVYAS
ncbi:MAG TPA: FAD-dependent oxidoreductase, partial [Opitutus sp.]|nr:FAD-dependent oxidoreductase [Opitutus sp.]